MALLQSSTADVFFLNLGFSLLFVQLVVFLVTTGMWVLQTVAPGARLATLISVMVVMTVTIVLVLSLMVVAAGFVSAETAIGWFVVRNVLVSFLLALGAARFLILQVNWKEHVAADSRARLDALQARIRPHFLFNALNTIAGVIHENPERAEEATLDLADLLRTGLRSDDRHSLDDELELVGRYLRLESLRLGERLQVAWQLADDLPLDQSLPPLLLQPLVENAIVHGISRRTDGGTVLIRGERIRFGRIRFTITNPLADAGGRSGSGSGTALENIRQRLALAYEERYGLKTGIEDGQFKAELTIPVS